MLTSDFIKFSRQTAIRAFAFLANAESTVERGFWLLIICLCAGLTIWNVTETVRNYRSGQTLTKIVTKNINEMNFGSPTICISFGSYFPFDQINQTVLARLDFTDPLMELVNLADKVTSEVDKNIEENNHRRYQIDPNDLVKLEVAYLLLMEISALENNLAAHRASEDIYDYISQAFLSRHNLVETVEFNQMINQLLRTNRLVDLQQSVGSLLCNLVELKAQREVKELNGSTELDMSVSTCNRSRITWMGSFDETDVFKGICVNLSHPQLFLFARETETEVTVSLNQRNDLGDPSIVSILDFTGNKLLGWDYSNMQELEWGKSVSATIETFGHFHNLHNKDKCSISQSPIDCLGYCMSAETTAICKCWPVNWHHLRKETDVPFCTVANYYGSGSFCKDQMINKSSKIENCRTGCRQLCDFNIYKLQEYDWEDAGENVTSELSLISQVFIDAHFIEVLAVDAKSFISQLGGSLSLYLGASFIGLLHVLIYVTRLIHSKLFPKELKAATSTTSPPNRLEADKNLLLSNPSLLKDIGQILIEKELRKRTNAKIE